MSEIDEMKVSHIDPARAKDLVSQLQNVQQRITAVAKGRPVRLVAVSKLKPANDILALHNSPHAHAHFGENYAQELAAKAALLPRSIHWHFIGGLQSSHCKALAKIPNLFAVSSIDSTKKAALLDKARGRALEQLADADADGADADADAARTRIGVHLQVNTSAEPSKSGAAPGAAVVDLARFVLTECPHLTLLGLMTIGAIARSAATATTPEAENEDFRVLREQRDVVAAELKEALGGRELELSMGMSEDFEGAIAMGSGEVRVGSTIFGMRGAKADAKVVV